MLNNPQDNSGSNRANRVPADKLFTCEVCGMQFRYLKSFKKHRLNHALERLHGKSEVCGEMSGELMVSSTNDESSTPRGVISLEDEQMLLDDQDQDDTIDSLSNTNSNTTNIFSTSTTTSNFHDPNNTSIPADNKNNTGGDNIDKLNSSAITECDKDETNGNITSSDTLEKELSERAKNNEIESNVNFTMPNIPNPFPNVQGSSASLKNLLNAENLSNQSLMGLNSQEVSILNYLRVDAADKNRDKRFACPFCGKCVRSKENLKLHVRKHTGCIYIKTYS
jgi:transcription elongation factor Elf1